jgi:hypothetical protein
MRWAYSAAAVTLLLSSTAMADLEIPPRLDMPDMRVKPREWDFLVRGYIGREENVVLDPRAAGSKTASENFGLAFDGIYRFMQTKEFSLGFELIGEGSAYSGESPAPGLNVDSNDFSYWAYTPKLFADYRFELGLPQHVALAYIYHYEQGANADALGLTSNTLHFVYGISPLTFLPQLNFDLHFLYGMDEYTASVRNPSRFSRDATRTGAELWINWDGKNGVRNTLVKIGYVKNEAQGVDFDYTRFFVDFSYEWQVWGPFWVSFDFGGSDGDYNGSHGQGGAVRSRGSQKEVGWSFKLWWYVDDHWVIDAWYEHRVYTSDNANFDTTANSFGVGVTYRF